MEDSTSSSEEFQPALVSSSRRRRKRRALYAAVVVLVAGLFLAVWALWARSGSLAPQYSAAVVLEGSEEAEADTAVVGRFFGSAFTSFTSTTLPSTLFCNRLAPMPGPVSPNIIEIQDPFWRDKCTWEKHKGHFEPPEGIERRNWCWVQMKQINKELAWRDGDITPPNWWWTQHHAARKGLAPYPTREIFYPLHTPELCDIPEHGAVAEPVSSEEWADAKDWVNKNVDIYVVNLDQAWLRMNSIGARLHTLGVNFTRIPGVYLGGEDGVAKAQAEGLIPADWSHQVAKDNLWRMYAGSEQSLFFAVGGIGTVGCATAALNGMKRAAELSRKPLALILEDDVWLMDDFAVKLRRLVEQEAPCDWEAISLKSYSPVGRCISPHLSRVYPDGMEPVETCRMASNWGFQSMLYRVETLPRVRAHLWNKVWNISTPTCLVHDIALAASSDIVNLYAVPACQRPGFLTFVRDGAGWREDLNH